MSWWSNAVFRLRALVSRSRDERALRDEVAFHLDMQARQLEAEGWAPAAAAAEARRRFGLVDRETQRAKTAGASAARSTPSRTYARRSASCGVDPPSP